MDTPSKTPLPGTLPFEPDTGEHDTSLPLIHFAGDARDLPSDIFARTHGPGFLVRALADGRLTPPAPLGSAEWRKKTQHVPAQSEGAPLKAPADAYLVYPLPFRTRKTIRVGRAHTCEVCVADMSVSTIHAELELDEERRLVITDRGSTNGSRVGREEVGFGDSATVDFGKMVQLGRVKLTYMPVEQFIDFVKLLAPVDVPGPLDIV